MQLFPTAPASDSPYPAICSFVRPISARNQLQCNDIPMPFPKRHANFVQPMQPGLRLCLMLRLLHPLLFRIAHIPWFLRLDIIQDLGAVEDCVAVFLLTFVFSSTFLLIFHFPRKKQKWQSLLGILLRLHIQVVLIQLPPHGIRNPMCLRWLCELIHCYYCSQRTECYEGDVLGD